MTQRGDIFSTPAYAQGKMLDHSGWKLPRNITPSDVDMVIDNDGSIIYGELSSWCSHWAGIKEGQRRLYQNAIRDGKHCAVLCRHSVKPEERRQIDTCYDIESFEAMFWEPGGPIWLRRFFLGRRIGMKLKSNGADNDAPDPTPKG